MTKNIDIDEIDKFSELAIHWWDVQGVLKTLHDINPLRLSYIQKHIDLTDKKIIDIGCGGGILAESMALQGGIVTGIDMSVSALKAGKLHRLETLEHHSNIQLDYQHITAEDMAEQHPGAYDIVTCMEMLEHVPDPVSVVAACAALLKPGGYAFFSTLNRNMKSYLYAIVGAEYILKILPKNTHDFSKFIRPSELTLWAREAKLSVQDFMGLQYDVFTKQFSLVEDVSVNYLVSAVR